MPKKSGVPGNEIDGTEAAAGLTLSRALRRALKRFQGMTANGVEDSARRDFIKNLSAAAAALGMPAVASQSLAAEDDDEVSGKRLSRRRKSRRTLFFNFAHLGNVDTQHYLYMGGQKYGLTRVADRPQVLRNERRSNAFLRAVPNDQITHHVRNVAAPDDVITLAYTTCNENPATGAWEMTAMHFAIPPTALGHAYAMARARNPRGPLPLSGKRLRYGVRAARTQQDLRDESVLIDTNSHAEALVGLHPDILSIEPESGGHIQTNYVSQDSNTQFLAALLQTMGPAAPQGMANVSGATPWATLMPLINDATGQPYKKSDNMLNQYYPDWNPQVDQNMAPAVGSVHPLVKNDPTLGVDVTGFNLNDPGNQVPPEDLIGTVWARHDGIPTVMVAPNATTSNSPTVAFTNQTPETGLFVTQPQITPLDDNRIQVTLDNVSNWFLRWLGVWVQFLAPDGTAIPLSQLPADTYPAEPGPYPRPQDKADAMFLGVVSPAVAILGIPVYPGQFAPTVNIPTSASTMRILYTGLGLSGSIPQDPQNVYDHGAIMTIAFNYGVVGLFTAAGASTFGPVFKLVVSLGGGSVAAVIIGIVGGQINQDSAAGAQAFAMNFLKTFFQASLSMILEKIVAAIAAALVAAELIDSIPVAGQIARAVAAVAGAAQLAETSIEIAVSPAAYIFDITETHDLSINILPDKNDNEFPEAPAGFSLYYKVSYLFDNGTAYTQDAVNVPDPTVKSIPITFPGIPRGGQVNISIGFYMRKSTTPAGQNDWCAGFGTTGLIDNTMDQAPDLAITEVKIPIQSTTKYVHTRKTALDAQSNHLWIVDPNGMLAPPYVPPPNGQQPGLGDFNAITVRQGTSNPPQQGYVGYAWKAFSSAVNGCAGPAPGQFDQMANLNTDAGNNGANAQDGYVNTANLCGYQPGVRIGYNLLTHNARNIYLDTTSLMVRPVSLDPPAFAGPASNQSFGMLNMDSTRCLLHPAGHIVSINNANHKIEAVKLPPTAVADTIAAQFFLARTYSGVGTRPGLITSPTALAIAPDGAILVLEEGNNRIQAFDLGGNPVPFFKQQPSAYFLQLAVTTGYTYLDLAVEFTGYLYVLSKDPNNNHRLDIYHPSQTGPQPISSTLNVNAAKIAVDFWRRAYTLNYEVLQLPNSGGIPGFTEPSVSQWLPTPPTT